MRHIHPMPEGLEKVFEGFNHVFVVENNDEGLNGYGQLCGLMRAKFADPKIRGINKTDGLTWRVKDVLARWIRAPRDERLALGRRSRRYVERWHDPRAIGQHQREDYEALFTKDSA